LAAAQTLRRDMSRLARDAAQRTLERFAVKTAFSFQQAGATPAFCRFHD